MAIMCPDKLAEWNSLAEYWPKVVRDYCTCPKNLPNALIQTRPHGICRFFLLRGKGRQQCRSPFEAFPNLKAYITKIYNTKSCDYLLIIHGSSHKTVFMTIIHFCSFVMSPLELSQFERLLYSHCCHISRIEWHCNIPLSNFMNRNQKWLPLVKYKTSNINVVLIILL